jgi:16S rRNA (uracil1498-N3)-methyltransferase
VSMHRFLGAGLEIGETTSIAGSELHHLRDVLRLRAGDHILISDPEAGQFAAVIESVDRDEALARILSPLSAPRTRHVTLFLGLLKGSKMDLVIQKATELAAEAVVPLVASRSVAKVSETKTGTKLARWQRIAAEACKQCGAAAPPAVRAPVDVEAAASSLTDFDAAVLFWEGDKCAPLSDALAGAGPEAKVAVIVGPEGGLTEDEVDTFCRAGAKCAGLGDLVLRSETAAIAGLAIVTYELSRKEAT